MEETIDNIAAGKSPGLPHPLLDMVIAQIVMLHVHIRRDNLLP